MSLTPRRVTLRHLRLALAVARSGSILKAANEIGVTQPALSKSIADLESIFGAPLFDRTNRGVLPTPHGEILLRRAAGMFDELRQAVDELAVLKDADYGELRIGATSAMCAGILARAIGTIVGERPRFRFEVSEMESGKLGSEVLARTLDLAIGPRHIAGDNEQLVFEALFEDRLFVVAGEGHPLAKRRAVALEEAAQSQWILPAPEGAVMAKLKEEFLRRKLPLPVPAVAAMSLPLRTELVASDGFLTVMYGSALRFGRRPAFLRVLPIELTSGIQIGLVQLKNRTPAPSADLFMHTIRNLVATMRTLNARQLRQ